jgi:hypothetical protein
MDKARKCGCPHCETELKKGCMGAEFCRPCGMINKKIKICAKCKAEYLSEYEECPSCAASNMK